MADEDEIDVLGDFSVDSFFAKSVSDMYYVSTGNDPNCDCGSALMGAQPLDHAPWCNKVTMYSDLTQNGHSSIKEVSVADETGWTTNEKSMLERGIEIFGRSSTRLSQFIGTKSAPEIKHYLANFYNSVQSNDNIKEESVLESSINEVVSDTAEIFDSNAVFVDEEIPACIEEVITVANNVAPPIKATTRRRSSSDYSDQDLYTSLPSGTSLLKSSVYRYKKISSTTDDDSEVMIVKRKKVKKSKQFDAKLKNHSNKKGLNVIKNITEDEAVGENSAHVNYINEVPRIVSSVNGEEVVKIEKAESDDEVDVELDIENDSEPEIQTKLTSGDSKNLDVTQQFCTLDEVSDCRDSEVATESNIQLDLSNLSGEIIRQLESMEVPSEEIILDENEVDDLEKCIHNEYFNGGVAKTRSRYLKIRNHIINMWISSKPNYVTKTSVRAGLKKCGDVNSMGRIHQYLEQIGAINFGCAQTVYSRPLLDMMSNFVGVRSKKLIREPTCTIPRLITLSRPRVKRKYETVSGDGGFTSTHDENGEIVTTMVVSETPAAKPKIHHKKPMPKLIYCKSFTEDTPPEYSIKLAMPAILLMDLHAHISRTEVMGLIGGNWDPKNKLLTVTRYVPCRNSAHSETHCEMCPLSQANAGDTIHSEDLDILGWFHSHPTFAPEPSQQDLDTQLLVQKWIGFNKPCIGMILSPFSTALIASPYRCMMVKKSNISDRFIPYKFDVKLTTVNFNIETFFDQAWQIINSEYSNSVDRLIFHTEYFLDPTISHLEKFISSVKMHLAKSSSLNEVTCNKIITGLLHLCGD